MTKGIACVGQFKLPWSLNLGSSQMAWKHIIYPIMTYFRQRRLAELLRAYPDLENYAVLDVGGRPFLWDLLKEHYQVQPKQLVLLNTPSENTIAPSPDYTVKVADGRSLPYPDKSFDLVFSNSVIEHVGDLKDMARFAQECNRVGKEIYIQTPNRWFPLEAHFGAAFVHWLPRAWYQKLSFLSLRYLCAFNNPVEKAHFQQEFDTTRLLSGRQLRELFPEKIVVAERALGLAKSFIVMSQAPQAIAEVAQPFDEQQVEVETLIIPAIDVQMIETPASEVQALAPQTVENDQRPENALETSTVEVHQPQEGHPPQEGHQSDSKTPKARVYSLHTSAIHKPVVQEPKLKVCFSSQDLPNSQS